MPKLRPLEEQVVVVTGASSGIGLATARLAAERGARVVLAARNEEALRAAAREIEAQGGEAAAVRADVGVEEEVRLVAEEARRRFGGFDTWVNDAGLSIYGRLEDVSLDDHHRLFDTNYWGVVHGSLVALEELRRRGGGAIVNVGSILSEAAFPLQGPYAAAKHAVKGFTEALRMELESEGAPIAVTLIEPSAIDTPFTRHARSYLGREPRNPGPAYTPEVVARAILHCAEHPKRVVVVGGAGRAVVAAAHLLPRVTAAVFERVVPRWAHSGPPLRNGGGALYEAGDGGHERGEHDGVVLRHSAYTQAVLHPVATALLVVGALGALAAWRARSR